MFDVGLYIEDTEFGRLHVVQARLPSVVQPKQRKKVNLMPASIELKRRLRWADSDAAGRLHFPRIIEIVEEAESEHVRKIGWPMKSQHGLRFSARKR
jgi:hypothetical protein